jgi:hypothetical protein
LKGLKKEGYIAGKGHNETLKIVNPVGDTRAALDVNKPHVPENGGT